MTGSIMLAAAVSGDEFDVNLANNQTSATVPIAPAVNLALSMVPTSDTVLSGHELTFAASVTNTGPSTATNVVLNFPIGAWPDLRRVFDDPGVEQLQFWRAHGESRCFESRIKRDGDGGRHTQHPGDSHSNRRVSPRRNTRSIPRAPPRRRPRPCWSPPGISSSARRPTRFRKPRESPPSPSIALMVRLVPLPSPTRRSLSTPRLVSTSRRHPGPCRLLRDKRRPRSRFPSLPTRGITMMSSSMWCSRARRAEPAWVPFRQRP